MNTAVPPEQSPQAPGLVDPAKPLFSRVRAHRVVHRRRRLGLVIERGAADARYSSSGPRRSMLIEVFLQWGRPVWQGRPLRLPPRVQARRLSDRREEERHVYSR